jgi:hypothetical protein
MLRLFRGGELIILRTGVFLHLNMSTRINLSLGWGPEFLARSATTGLVVLIGPRLRDLTRVIHCVTNVIGSWAGSHVVQVSIFHIIEGIYDNAGC